MAARFGMIGLGTMGRNLVLNIADHGFEVCGYDRDENQRNRLLQESQGKPITIAASSQELINNLQTPRIIMLLVPAGKVVDIVIDELLPQLAKGDIIIDGGNSHFTDTERRYQALQNSGMHFIGMGVSGGEEGARNGPSMMPGGNTGSYELVKEILETVAAKADGEPCVAYTGHAAAGHYVKMVHNGIEYAIMQMISEIYGLLKISEFSNAELHDTFKEWNNAELQSFLVEITADVFAQKDIETGNDLVDMILDRAQQKGTGLWTSQSALELNVPTPTIDIAVTMRYLSSLKNERIAISKLFSYHQNNTDTDKGLIKNICKNALYFGFAIAYAQGIQLLQAASAFYKYDTDIKIVLKIWRGGCIIRSVMLNDLHEAYLQQSDLLNVIASPVFSNVLQQKRNDVVHLLKAAMDAGSPAAGFASALNYFDAYTSEKLPANLIQAQRDFFGAHTYERIDKDGSFHTKWEASPQPIPQGNGL